MIDSHLSGVYQRLLVLPVARMCRLSANTITILGLLSGLVSALCIALDWPYWAACLLLLSGYLDSLDGVVARYYAQSSNQGCVLDVFCDRMVECAVMLGLLLVDPGARALAAFLMLGASYLCITSFLVTAIFSKQAHYKSFHYSPGLMERCEAFVFFIVMILWPAGFTGLAFAYSSLVLLTALMRVGQFIYFHRLSNI
ncbi:Inner membrane protein YnjF [Piscirickettsia salmonis]|uniref:CDP-alcohol phosphatidyltransferase family protein n=2 Tax=Piscirickettsia salmonis TaxID=1238 RepID=UPI0012B6D785|nr:Inner membrane protein YnjF [Piscirickettsia salmonis]